MKYSGFKSLITLFLICAGMDISNENQFLFDIGQTTNRVKHSDHECDGQGLENFYGQYDDETERILTIAKANLRDYTSVVKAKLESNKNFNVEESIYVRIVDSDGNDKFIKKAPLCGFWRLEIKN